MNNGYSCVQSKNINNDQRRKRGSVRLRIFKLWVEDNFFFKKQSIFKFDERAFIILNIYITIS